MPVGTVISYFSAKDEHDNYIVPFGYLACDGSQYNQADYPALAALLTAIDSTTFGSPGATHFNVPDLQGEFLRGIGKKSGDTSDYVGTTRTGQHQDATKHLNINVSSGSNNIIIGTISGQAMGSLDADWWGTSRASQRINCSGTKQVQDSAEPYYTSHPTNTSVLYCIKY